MTDLPIFAVLPDLLAALRTGSNAVLVAPPGAGKTTSAAATAKKCSSVATMMTASAHAYSLGRAHLVTQPRDDDHRHVGGHGFGHPLVRQQAQPDPRQRRHHQRFPRIPHDGPAAQRDQQQVRRDPQ